MINNLYNIIPIMKPETPWVYSGYGANFVKTMLRLGKKKEQLGVIFDQVGTPTYAIDLAKAILEILPKIKKHFSISIPYWKDRLDECLKIMGVRK